jgi:hypothetical protein
MHLGRPDRVKREVVQLSNVALTAEPIKGRVSLRNHFLRTRGLRALSLLLMSVWPPCVRMRNTHLRVR